MAAQRRGSTTYDYLLVVGPGRSGSALLHENLKRHPDFCFPEIKEGYYYRSPSRFDKARRQADGRILTDIANLAYGDRTLSKGIKALQAQGWRILLLALLREHRARAASMARFRKSRGELSALLGAKKLEQAVMRDQLTPAQLSDLYGLGADTLTVCFPALTQNTAAFLARLAALCGAAPFEQTQSRVVNPSTQARHPLLSAIGKLSALALRRAGRRALLQRLKDSKQAQRLFFVPLREDAEPLSFRPDNLKTLDAAYRECRALMERETERLDEHVYFRTADAAPPPRR